MTVKFVPIHDVDEFEISRFYKPTSHVIEHALHLLPEAEIVTERPKDEFYFLLTSRRSIGWRTEFSDPSNLFYSDLLNKKCGLIIYLNEVESLNVSSIVHGMKNLIRDLNIDSDLLYYIDSNVNNRSTLNNFNLNGSFFNYYDSLFVNNNYNETVKSIENLQERSKKMLLLGGKSREHRLKFIHKVLQLPNFEEDNFISTMSGSYFDNTIQKSIKVEERLLDGFLHDTTILDKFSEPTQHGPTHLFHLESNLHTDSYFQIVTSTWFELDLNRIEINEKHARPMYSLQPFIVYGEPNTLKAFKEMGYKTYSNWIDESYDETYDDQLRFDKVVAVVESINAMSRVELSKMMKEMLPTLLHNIEHHNKRVNELEIEYNLFNEITETYKDYLITQ